MGDHSADARTRADSRDIQALQRDLQEVGMRIVALLAVLPRVVTGRLRCDLCPWTPEETVRLR